MVTLGSWILSASAPGGSAHAYGCFLTLDAGMLLRKLPAFE